MKIETLKELKEALDCVPIDVLDQWSVGFSEDGEVSLLLTTENAEGDFMEANRLYKEHPHLNLIGGFLEDVAKLGVMASKEDNDDWDRMAIAENKKLKPKKAQ